MYGTQQQVKLHAGIGGLLTKYYLSKVVQRWITKQGENLARSLLANRYAKVRGMFQLKNL